MQKYAPWAPAHIAAGHVTWRRHQIDTLILHIKKHGEQLSTGQWRTKDALKEVYTTYYIHQAVECKAPVTVIKIEEWEHEGYACFIIICVH